LIILENLTVLASATGISIIVKKKKKKKRKEKKDRFETQFESFCGLWLSMEIFDIS
jgi:hypothetical protein